MSIYFVGEDDPIGIVAIFNAQPRTVGVTPIIRSLLTRPRVRAGIYLATRRQRVLSRIISLFGLPISCSLSVVEDKRSLCSVASHILHKLRRMLRGRGPSCILIRKSAAAAFATSLTTFCGRVGIKRIRTKLHAKSLTTPFPRRTGHRLANILTDLRFTPARATQRGLLHRGGGSRGVFIIKGAIVSTLLSAMGGSCAFRSRRVRTVRRRGHIVLIAARHHRGLNTPVRRICHTLHQLIRAMPSARIMFPIRQGPLIHRTIRRRLSNTTNVRLIRPVRCRPFAGLVTQSTLILASSNNVRRRTPDLKGPILILHSVARHPRTMTTKAMGLMNAKRRGVCRATCQLLASRTTCRTVTRTIGPCNSNESTKHVIRALLCTRKVSRGGPSGFVTGWVHVYCGGFM